MVLADGTRPRKHAIVETAHIGTTPPNRTRTVPFKNEKTFGMEENENADPSPLPPSGLPRQLPRAAGERPALRHAAAPANGALARAAVGPSARHEARPPAPAPRAAGDERPAAAALRREAVGVRGRAPALRQATAQHRAPCEAHARGGAGRASHEQRRRSALARGAVGRVHGTGPAPRRRLTAGATVPPPPLCAWPCQQEESRLVTQTYTNKTNLSRLGPARRCCSPAKHRPPCVYNVARRAGRAQAAARALTAAV